MKLSISGQHVDVGDSLTNYVKQIITDNTKGFFNDPIDGHVKFSKQRHQFLVEITLHPMTGFVVQGHGAADDAYAAFDLAAEKIKRQLRRYKARIKDHKIHKGIKANGYAAQQFVLEHDVQSEEAHDHDHQPVIIAEMEAEVNEMSVGEAVMHMDLRDAHTLVFKNKKNGDLNVIYRRPDGNIGWINPAHGS